jgi:CrcB protein
MWPSLLIIGIGGATGSIARWLISTTTTPNGTFIANMIGCLLAGIAITLIDKSQHPLLAQGIMVGFLGGLTTFSAMSVETTAMIQSGRLLHAAGYIGVSVVGGISLIVIGIWLGNMLYSPH